MNKQNLQRLSKPQYNLYCKGVEYTTSNKLLIHNSLYGSGNGRIH